MKVRRQYIFAYGSLAAERDGAVAALRGHERVWGVAMENARDLPGYKHYRLRSDGSRPDVVVAFVDLRPGRDCSVMGRRVAVDDTELALLDRRERNYDRVDVTAHVDAAPDGTVWAYLGTERARARLEDGRRRATAVVSRDYLALVCAGIAALGGAELEAFERSGGLQGLPVLDLERVDAADAGG